MFAWVFAMAASMSVAGPPSEASDRIDFAADVQPILQRYCVGCHTEDDPQGGFVMETHVGLMAGGDSGMAITAGEPASSRMLLLATGRRDPVMPPAGEPRPGEEELALLSAWIEAGAAGPEGESGSGATMPPSLRVPDLPPADEAKRPITAIALAPGGGPLAVARFGRVEIVDGDGDPIVVLGEQPGKVHSLAFSRDGARLLIAGGLTGSFGRAALHDVADGRLIREFVGHRDTLYAAAFSPDERLIATAGYDANIVVWDAESGQRRWEAAGHNGAVFSLAFSPNGEVLVSGSADETVKVWDVASGRRLDTMSQPEGEVHAVAVTPDGRHVVAGSGDNRVRVWRLESIGEERINPLAVTRFVDEAAVTALAITSAGDGLVAVSEAGNLIVLDTKRWELAGSFDPLGDVPSDLVLGDDGQTCLISLMDGRLIRRELTWAGRSDRPATGGQTPIWMDLDPPVRTTEAELAADRASDAEPHPIPRGAIVTGVISAAGEVDRYRWHANAGEVWAIDGDAEDGSPIDPIVSIVDDAGEPVLRARLQAIRDSYFTFRGKDSHQSSDFRLFGWQELQLDDYLYAAGEVTRLWMHPRGPDSGFNVYPGQGDRWTYFGTTHTTHALGEPAYVVRELAEGEPPVANGLPVFDIPYENDDDPMRRAGKNSRLLFTAPAEGHYTVRIADTRGEGGADYRYRLTLRAAQPAFVPRVQAISKPIPLGGGREFVVSVDRLDGFDGPVRFELDHLPPGLVTNAPLVVEAGQSQAIGTIWADPAAGLRPATVLGTPVLTASAVIHGRHVERRVGPIGELSLADETPAIPAIEPLDATAVSGEPWVLSVRRGQTVSARLRVQRREGFATEIGFGKEFAARNAPHGVYVDNIGLNGLLVRENEDVREFFLTADPVAALGRREFFLTAEVDGGVSTRPVVVEVLP